MLTSIDIENIYLPIFIKYSRNYDFQKGHTIIYTFSILSTKVKVRKLQFENSMDLSFRNFEERRKKIEQARF